MNYKKCLFQWLLLACTAVLAGCGGGGSSATPAANMPAPAPTVIQGVYAATINGPTPNSELWTVVTPDLNWYALLFRNTNYPDIYSGQLSLGVNGLATRLNTQLYAYQATGTSTLPADNLTSGSLQSYSGTLTVPTATPPLQSVTAGLSSGYRLTDSPTLAQLEGNWSGTWTDGSSTSLSLLLRINNGILSTPNFDFYCVTDTPSVASLDTRGNFYNLTLHFSSVTGQTCNRAGQTLSGVAIIDHPTVTTKRLQIVAVNTGGSGVSYRSVPQPN